jgi:ABC-type bacteriocin/lantibiotic exporter with double-glycine peptidase domain
MITISLAIILAGMTTADEQLLSIEGAVALDDYVPCGLISLYLVCRTRELSVTWKQVEELVGAPGSGGELDFARLATAAKQLGMHPVGLKAKPPFLAGLPMPAIVQVHDSLYPAEIPHFLVLLQVEEDGVWLLGAPYPAYFLAESRFEESWTGNVLAFAKDEGEANRIRA